MKKPRVLAMILARGGSKGLPGKNIRPFAGLPLIAHSILCAKACPEVTRVLVSTDSEAIARVCRRFGADVPFKRPAHMARSGSPTWPVIRHALAFAEKEEGRPYDFVLLLDPTSLTRTPEEVRGALRKLLAAPKADGILSASEPEFSPIWHSVVEKKGWMTDLIQDSSKFVRRQDLPRVFRINGLIYIWRTGFLRRMEDPAKWRKRGKHLIYETPELRACSIDTLEQFQKTEALVRAGLIPLPWLKKGGRR